MSMNSEAFAVDLDAVSENSAYDEDVVSENDPAENQRELSNSEYDCLEDAVMQTARGRTFLREHARRNRAVASDLVMRALEDLQNNSKRQEVMQPSEILSAELKDMSDAISHTRRDIAAIKPQEGANNRIMAATEDLDAIVTSTERATNEILTAAERIQESCDALRQSDADSGLCDVMDENIINIFLACSFQDLTGQRTTKVVNALHYLEQRVGAMVQIWGSETLRNASKDEFDTGLEADGHPEAGLLNGPQTEGKGVAQDDIDQMLREGVDLAIGNGADPTDGIDFDEPDNLSTMPTPEDRPLDDDITEHSEGDEVDALETTTTY